MAKPKKDSTAVEQQQPKDLMRSPKERRGFENADQSDFTVPRIKLMQKGSPEIDKDNQNYVEGIEQGDFINSVTTEKYEKPLRIIPILFQKSRIKYDDNGIECASLYSNGQKPDTGVRHTDVCSKCEFSQFDEETGEPPECSLMYQFPSLIHKGEDDFDIAAASFASTSLKTGRKLLNMARFSGGDLFSRAYELADSKQSDSQYTWRVFTIRPAGKAEDDEYAMAEMMYDRLSETDYEVDVENQPKDDQALSEEDKADLKGKDKPF